MKTLTSHYMILSERIKTYIQEFGPRSPENLKEKLHHRFPPIVQFTVYTMLFSGEASLNYDGNICLE